MSSPSCPVVGPSAVVGVLHQEEDVSAPLCPGDHPSTSGGVLHQDGDLPALPPVVAEFEGVHCQAGLSTVSSGLDDCDKDGSDAVPSVAPPSPLWSTARSASSGGSPPVLWLLPMPPAVRLLLTTPELTMLPSPSVRSPAKPPGFPDVNLSPLHYVASPEPAIISVMAPALPTDLASFVVRPRRTIRTPRAPPDNKDCGLCTRLASLPFVGRRQVNLVYAS